MFWISGGIRDAYIPLMDMRRNVFYPSTYKKSKYLISPAISMGKSKLLALTSGVPYCKQTSLGLFDIRTKYEGSGGKEGKN